MSLYIAPISDGARNGRIYQIYWLLTQKLTIRISTLNMGAFDINMNFITYCDTLRAHCFNGYKTNGERCADLEVSYLVKWTISFQQWNVFWITANDGWLRGHPIDRFSCWKLIVYSFGSTATEVIIRKWIWWQMRTNWRAYYRGLWRSMWNSLFDQSTIFFYAIVLLDHRV